MILTRTTVVTCGLRCLILMLARNTVLARYNCGLRYLLEELASLTQRTLARGLRRLILMLTCAATLACGLPHLILMLACAAFLARHWRRLRHLVEELARNAQRALAVCLSRHILKTTHFACIACKRFNFRGWNRSFTKFTGCTCNACRLSTLVLIRVGWANCTCDALA